MGRQNQDVTENTGKEDWAKDRKKGQGIKVEEKREDKRRERTEIERGKKVRRQGKYGKTGKRGRRWRQMSALRNWKKAGAGADTDH